MHGTYIKIKSNCSEFLSLAPYTKHDITKALSINQKLFLSGWLIWVLKNMVEADRPKMVIQCYAWALHAGYLRLQTHTDNMQYLLLFHGNNGNANAPQYYILHIVHVLFEFSRNLCRQGKHAKLLTLIMSLMRLSVLVWIYVVFDNIRKAKFISKYSTLTICDVISGKQLRVTFCHVLPRKLWYTWKRKPL
jgi:hypothetical protein